MTNIPEKRTEPDPTKIAVLSSDQRKGQYTSKPNEVGGFYFSSMVKITDQTSGQVLVHIRGD